MSSGAGRCSCHCEPVIQAAKHVPKIQVKYVPVVVNSAPRATNRPDHPPPASGQMERERRRDAIPRHQHFPNSQQQHKHRDPDLDDEHRHPLDPVLRTPVSSSSSSPDYDSRSGSGLIGMPNDASEETDDSKIPLLLTDGVRYSDTGNSPYDREPQQQQQHRSPKQQQQKRQQRVSQQAKQGDNLLSDGNRLKQGHRPGNRDSVKAEEEVALDAELDAGGMGDDDGGGISSRGSGGRASGGGRGMGGSYGHKQQEDHVDRESGSSSRSVRGGEGQQDEDTDAGRGDEQRTSGFSTSSLGSSGRGQREEQDRDRNLLADSLDRLANKPFVIESTESEIDSFPFSNVPFDVKYLI